MTAHSGMSLRQVLAASLATLVVAACQPTVSTHGHQLDPALLAQIQPGTTSREEVSRLIGSHDPIIAAHVLRSRGTRPLYQARIGAETRLAANDLCGTIRRAGAACVVLRNGH